MYGEVAQTAPERLASMIRREQRAVQNKQRRQSMTTQAEQMTTTEQAHADKVMAIILQMSPADDAKLQQLEALQKILDHAHEVHEMPNGSAEFFTSVANIMREVHSMQQVAFAEMPDDVKAVWQFCYTDDEWQAPTTELVEHPVYAQDVAEVASEESRICCWCGDMYQGGYNEFYCTGYCKDASARHIVRHKDSDHARYLNAIGKHCRRQCRFCGDWFEQLGPTGYCSRQCEDYAGDDDEPSGHQLDLNARVCERNAATQVSTPDSQAGESLRCLHQQISATDVYECDTCGEEVGRELIGKGMPAKQCSWCGNRFIGELLDGFCTQGCREESMQRNEQAWRDWHVCDWCSAPVYKKLAGKWCDEHCQKLGWAYADWDRTFNAAQRTLDRERYLAIKHVEHLNAQDAPETVLEQMQQKIADLSVAISEAGAND